MTNLSKRQIDDLEKDSNDIANSLDLDSLKAQLFELEKESIEEGFWENTNLRIISKANQQNGLSFHNLSTSGI